LSLTSYFLSRRKTKNYKLKTANESKTLDTSSTKGHREVIHATFDEYNEFHMCEDERRLKQNCLH
jgi:hypothetical protein